MEAKDAKDAEDARDAEDAKDARDASDAENAMDARDARDAEDARDVNDAWIALAHNGVDTVNGIALVCGHLYNNGTNFSSLMSAGNTWIRTHQANDQAQWNLIMS